ncbi:hypothetical protein PAPYR_9649 [Paratrimastix pyriformis]|uniref:TLC domain-containing protein n=1 Tax=Paratrimastix pyriformis TaxID=342808 RepID=A0ABQ8U7X0_9EUKA|nr:hypothetical protein PAPYR_9649 [Paratrimastix pyriformis]
MPLALIPGASVAVFLPLLLWRTKWTRKLPPHEADLHVCEINFCHAIWATACTLLDLLLKGRWFLYPVIISDPSPYPSDTVDFLRDACRGYLLVELGYIVVTRTILYDWIFFVFHGTILVAFTLFSFWPEDSPLFEICRQAAFVGLWGEATAVLLGIEELTKARELRNWANFGTIWTTSVIFFIQRIVALFQLTIATIKALLRVGHPSVPQFACVAMMLLIVGTNAYYFVTRVTSDYRRCLIWAKWRRLRRQNQNKVQ